MKKLGRLLAALMAAAMLFSLAACSSSSSDDADEEEEETEAVEEETEESEEAEEAEESEEAGEEAEEAEEEADSVEGALEGVTLTFGTTALFAPFTYYDEDGTTLIGYDMDLMELLQEYLGFEVESIEVTTYSALTTSLAEGMIDFGMAALCATDERKEVMDFTNTYCDSGQILCINSETSPEELTDVSMLTSGDYVVAVESGTASHLYVVNAGVPDECIEVHDSITTAYESLEQGKVDCLIQDLPGMAYYIKTAEETSLEMVGEEFNQGQSPYCVAFSYACEEENEGIVEIFNQALAVFEADGTLDELYEKWCS